MSGLPGIDHLDVRSQSGQHPGQAAAETLGFGNIRGQCCLVTQADNSVASGGFGSRDLWPPQPEGIRGDLHRGTDFRGPVGDLLIDWQMLEGDWARGAQPGGLLRSKTTEFVVEAICP